MGEPRVVAIEALRAALGERAATLDIEWVDETGSTSTDLLERPREASAAERPVLRVADRQTAGRGRRGRAWQATPGGSLTFSLASVLASSDWAGLSLAVGVALAEAMTPPAPGGAHRIGLKWPNDLWLVDANGAGRKLGGILVETVPLADGRRVAVVGVGINIAEQGVHEASSGVAWLREIDPQATASALLGRVAAALIDALSLFEREGFAAFAARFEARDLLRGRPVRCTASPNEAAVEGVAIGVSPTGELLVRSERGVERISSGEVSVRLAERQDDPASWQERAGFAC